MNVEAVMLCHYEQWWLSGNTYSWCCCMVVVFQRMGRGSPVFYIAAPPLKERGLALSPLLWQCQVSIHYLMHTHTPVLYKPCSVCLNALSSHSQVSRLLTSTWRISEPEYKKQQLKQRHHQQVPRSLTRYMVHWNLNGHLSLCSNKIVIKILGKSEWLFSLSLSL